MNNSVEKMDLTGKDPEKIRISAGSAAILGLTQIKFDVPPTTCYLMTSTDKHCIGHCAFCPQGNLKNSKRIAQLSRINWPEFSWNVFFSHLLRHFKEPHPIFQRICLQIINYPAFFPEIQGIISTIRSALPNVPISIAVPPISAEKIQILHDIGLSQIAIALDACTSTLFTQIKGKGVSSPYTWEKHWASLLAARKIFGIGATTTHLIVGLGETEEEMLFRIRQIIEYGILPGIFCFMPVYGTPLAEHPSPSLQSFRRIQVGRQLMLIQNQNYHRFQFENGILIRISQFSSQELQNLIDHTSAFKTAGCPDCNRPYYTSRPGEEPDGFPRDLTKLEKQKVFKDLEHLLDEK